MKTLGVALVVNIFIIIPSSHQDQSWDKAVNIFGFSKPENPIHLIIPDYRWNFEWGNIEGKSFSETNETIPFDGELKVAACQNGYDGVYLVYNYSPRDGVHNDSKFSTFFECLNYLIQNKFEKTRPVIYFKKYLNMTSRPRNYGYNRLKSEGKKIKVFCNNGSDPKTYRLDEIRYHEDYESKTIYISNELNVNVSLKKPNPFVRDPTSDLSRSEFTDYNNTVDGDLYKSSWTRIRPAEYIEVSAHTKVTLTEFDVEVRTNQGYEVDFEIDDTLENEDSQRFKIFRQKVKNGEVKLHQIKDRAYIDFEKDDLIVVRKAFTVELITAFTKQFILSKPSPWDPVECKE